MMKPREEMTELDFEDPMDWIYELRRRISEQYGHDIGCYMEAMKEKCAHDEANGVHYVRLPIARRVPNVV